MTGDGRIGWPEATPCIALPCLILIAVGHKSLPAVLDGGLMNADSYMRMVRLRETLAWHHPAYIVTGDASGHGTLLHWSHLLDSLVVLLAAPFTLFVAPAIALHWAAMLAGPIAIGGLGYAIAWAAAPFAGTRRWLWLGPLLMACSPAITAYGVPGVVHHHVPVLVAAVMAGGCAARIIAGNLRPGTAVALGAWAGCAIWLTPEITPLLLVIFGGVWLAWISMPRRGDLAPAMSATGFAFVLVVTAAWLVDPPYAGYASIVIDRLSILFVGLALVVLASAIGAVLIDRAAAAFAWRMPARVAAAVLAGGACFALWVAAFTVVLHGPDGLISAADWHAMFDVINEMKPVQNPSQALGLLLTGLLAAGLLCWLAWHRRSLLLAYAALCAFGMVAIGQMHVRFSAYPETLAAIMLPIALRVLEESGIATQPIRLARMRVSLIALFLVVPPLGSALTLSRPADAAQSADRNTCSVSGIGAMLAPFAGRVVLGDVSATPELLYRTRVLTVGSLYHRDMTAFLRLRAAWRSLPAATVPPAVTATRAAFVLFCPTGGRSPLVADLPHDTLADRLNRGVFPPWLQPAAADPASGNILYRIVQ